MAQRRPRPLLPEGLRRGKACEGRPHPEHRVDGAGSTLASNDGRTAESDPRRGNRGRISSGSGSLERASWRASRWKTSGTCRWRRRGPASAHSAQWAWQCWRPTGWETTSDRRDGAGIEPCSKRGAGRRKKLDGQELHDEADRQGRSRAAGGGHRRGHPQGSQARRALVEEAQPWRLGFGTADVEIQKGQDRWRGAPAPGQVCADHA